jgi:hypothetical protein
MNSWYSGVYKAFILSSVISFFISFFTTGLNSYGSTLTGYSTLLLGVIMILVSLFNNILRVTQGNGSFSSFYLMISSTGPFLIMLGVLGFLLYLTINYKNLIVENHVSQSYYTFRSVTIILFLLQTFMVFSSINSQKFMATAKLPPVTSSLLYLLGVLSIFSTWIIYITLKYYTTDGFQNNKCKTN